MKKELLPSDFMNVHPWSSVLAKSEQESLACSIMATRKWKGDYWAGGGFAELTYRDYLDYRSSIGATGNASVEQFDKVHVYCKFPDTAALFSPTWKKLVDDFEMEQQAVCNVPLVVEDDLQSGENWLQGFRDNIMKEDEDKETWDEAEERTSYQQSDIQDFQNKTGSYAVGSSLEDAAGKSWESANKFLHGKGGVNPTPFVMGFKSGANYQKEKDKAIIKKLILFLEGCASRMYKATDEYTEAETLIEKAKQYIQ